MHTCMRVLGGKKYLFFSKFGALFSCNTGFEIRPFALLPTNDIKNTKTNK